MRRISALFLCLCILFSFAIPATAFAADGADAATPTQGDESGIDVTADETEQGGISILSGWEGGDSEFFTKIRLTATDRNGNPIAGAVYGLYRTSDDSLVEYLTTDSYGVAVSSDVPVETDYYLLEYTTPEGFLPNDEPKHINLSEICAPSRVDENVVYDPLTGYIKVIKTDEDGYSLSGVGFYIYQVDGWNLVDTIYTDEYGEAVSTLLPYGDYELYEFDVPDGFEGGGYYNISITDHEEIHEIEITNYKARGYARVYKTGNDGRNVSGAVYSIYRVDLNGDEWIEDITTNSSGYAYSSNLLLGDYYAVEKSVPAAYVLDETKHYFSLTYSGEYNYINIVNNRAGQSGAVRVIKTDDSENTLSGVVFGLYRAWDGTKLGELVTGADGTATYSPLIPDDYYLVELTGKPGYTMATGQIPFTIDGSGETVEKTVENPKIRVFGKVKVTKSDDIGNPISSVRFGVYCYMGNLLEEITTGPDGTATSGVLNEGTGYYLLELEGVSGYLSDTQTQYPFDITTNGVVVPITVTNPRISGSIRVIKDDGEDNPLSGVVFGIYKSGQKLAELVTDENGVAESGTLYYGSDYELRELSTVEGYELIDTPIPFSILEQGEVIEIPFSNPLILGSVTVIKVDADEVPQVALLNDEIHIGPSPMAGAVFGIYNAKGQKIAEITVGDDGTATYDGLPQSAYFLKELTPPEGFILRDELIPFSINEQGENVEITVENAKGFGTVQVIKSGEDEMLFGVIFEIYRASTDEMVAELVTSEGGIATKELPLGNYYLIEKSTVDGYRLLSGRIAFTLTTPDAIVEIPIQNQREPAPEGGTIKLIKVDEQNSEKLLPGAVFGIYRASDDEKVAEFVTGSDGMATSPALPESESGYYLLELTPPAAYKAITDKIPVEVTNGTTTEITVENAPDEEPPAPTGKLELIKSAKETGARLENAVFGVYRADNDSKVAELTTDKNGKASVELPEGDFYLKELTPPTGFKLLTDPIPFTITGDTIKEIVVVNEPLGETEESYGSLKIIKRAEGSNEKLKDAVFGVYRADNDKKVAELTTDKNGVASVELPEGDYYLKELAAPKGFRLVSDKTSFTIVGDTTKEITIANSPLPDEETGTILLIKKAGGTGKLLEDAVFGAYRKSNNEKVGELTTDSYGEATIELPLGDYYLKELRAPAGGYVLETDTIPFRISKADTTVKVEVTNTLGRGNIRLIKNDEDGKGISGAVFILYEQGGAKIAEIATKNDGTAVYELPTGSFYLVEKTAPVGFQLDTQRHNFKVENGKTTDVKVINKRVQGTVNVYFRHVQDGRELSPMKSYTDKVGTDYILWMRSNGYENMAISGYNLIRTDYPSSFVLIDGTLTVTLWYDSGEVPSGGITIPKTGEAPPYGNYLLAALCMGLAGLCGVMLYKGRKGKRNPT